MDNRVSRKGRSNRAHCYQKGFRRDSKKIYSKNINKKKPFLVGVDIKWNEPKKSDIIIKNFFNKNVSLVKKNILIKINKKLF